MSRPSSDGADAHQAFLIICRPDRDGTLDSTWLQALREAFPAARLFARPAQARAHDLDVLQSPANTLDALLAALPNPDRLPVLVLASGMQPVPFLACRLAALAEDPACPALTWLPNNRDAGLNPVAGLDEAVLGENLDSLVAACGARRWTRVRRLQGRALMLRGDVSWPAGGLSELEQAVIDTVLLHDPRFPRAHGKPGTPIERAAFGQLGSGLAAMRDTGQAGLPYFGLDPRPVTLHVSHAWGGGIARWIADQCRHDKDGLHLVLVAAGNPDGQEHGQRLCLYALGPGGARLADWVLEPPIADTALKHAQYADLLDAVLARYRVGRVLVSSLIGHSLDCLRTGLPTGQVLHDFYPASPVLDIDPQLFVRADSGFDVAAALATQSGSGLFSNRSPGHWQAIREGWLETVTEQQLQLIAPTRHVAARWAYLFPGRLDGRIEVVAHGQPPIPEAQAVSLPAPPAGRPLSLVVIGRLSEGKGLGLLEQALPELTRMARLTLIGAGKRAEALFGRRGVDIVIDYQADQLPELLAVVRPHAVLFLSTVPETWNYVLSEIRQLGLVPIATRVGSFVERIRDRQDGILFEPLAEDLVATVRKLAQAPEQLARLAGKARPEPSLSDSLARYRELVPHASPAKSASGVQSSQLGLSLDELGQCIRELARREAQIEDIQAELARRTDWAQRQQRLAEERTAWARSLETSLEQTGRTLSKLQQEFDARSQWALELSDALERAREHGREQSRLAEERAGQLLALGDELAQLRQRLLLREAELTRLQVERDELLNSLAMTRDRADALQMHLDLVLNSRSWRLTRPIRFGARLARKLRNRRAWNPLKWPGLMIALLASLRQQGWSATLARLHHQALPGQGSVAAAGPLEETVQPVTAMTAITADELAAAPLSDPVSFPDSDQPQVSIVIPVYNKVELTAACLNSLAGHPCQSTVEVIVVDDCSGDGTADYLEECSGLTVLRNTDNAGFIDSCNRGAAAARGEFLVFLNNDTTVTEGWLDALLAPLQDDPSVGIVGARLVYPDGRLQEAGGMIFRDGTGWNYGRGDDPELPQYNFLSEADYVSGACLAIRRREFQELGGFDRRYRPAYYEDTDLCFQVRAAGRKVIYQPAATIIHHEGATSGTDEASGTKRYQAVNRDKFRERWADMLAEHPPAEPDFNRADPVRHLRYRRFPRRLLLIDAVMPQPDHDSGSVRIVAMMELLRDMGYQVSFMPENRLRVAGYGERLQQAGIELLCAPQVSMLEPWLEQHGPALDMIIVSRHYVLAPMLELLRRYAPQAPLVFDTVDLHFLREEREAEVSKSAEIAARADATRRQELALIEASDVTLVVSPVEQQLLATLVPEADVRIVSNIHDVHGSRAGWEARGGIMFVGGFQHLPNVDAARWLVEDIFPRVQRQIPGIELHLIGSRMPPEIREIDMPGVLVHGFVEDLAPFLAGCRVSVAPLRYGAGVKGKVNQAMAHGLPVVATSCAAEGMFLRDDEDVLIADDAGGFADAVVRLHENAELWARLSAAGMANVERHFSREAARRALVEMEAAIRPPAV
ncbi:MAG: glycosyltransferase [Wenzhouxiangellaceae bacterium]|nr:MAG: glycosyltransferase [Wenzhouxiangellaceae bacterium]